MFFCVKKKDSFSNFRALELSCCFHGDKKLCEGASIRTRKGVFENNGDLGCRMAQSVRWPTLDFGSGHDLRVVRSNPTSGSALGMESA